ncbi:MAG TPA: hypothetical protein VFP21_01170, partial [Solirubrobacterales bacterium]|nr:hypothetical protein [Solirubrobacterales bacterium]
RKEVLQMCKKLIMTCVAIAAFVAFVVAPVASASPVLTSEGKAVAAGAEVKGSNTGLFKFEGSNNYLIECSSMSMQTSVTVNSGTKLELEAPAGAVANKGTATGEDCTASWGPAKMTWGKMCFTATKGSDSLSIAGCGGEAILTTNITGVVSCQYAVSSSNATFSTGGDATFTVSSLIVKKTSEGGGIFCPPSVEFTMVFDLTTSSGGTLSIS